MSVVILYQYARVLVICYCQLQSLPELVMFNYPPSRVRANIRVILSVALNFYIPIPRTTENMKTTHIPDAVIKEKVSV